MLGNKLKLVHMKTSTLTSSWTSSLEYEIKTDFGYRSNSEDKAATSRIFPPLITSNTVLL